MPTRFFIAALLLIALGGCVTPTEVRFTRTVTTPDGVTESTEVVGSALPKNWTEFYFNWEGVVTLQGGQAITVQPDYTGIVTEVVPIVMCQLNPLSCPPGN